jgi:hypothetical protein
VQRLRIAEVSARQLSQIQVVRSFVVVLMVVSPSVEPAPTTVGSRGVGDVSHELRLPTDESRSPRRSYLA